MNFTQTTNINQTSTPSNATIDRSQPPIQQSQSNYLLYSVIGIILIFAFLFIFRKKSKGAKREIGIVGERGSGKTQLFMNISGGKSFNTVPSISNNICKISLGNKQYQLTDFIGDNLSKEQVVSQIARFHTLVHIVDGTDSKKLGDAALFIYRVLISKEFQKDSCNYLLMLNKNDEKGFHGVQKLVKRIQDEIQTIKSTRRNQTQDNQGEEDYLRNDRTRFDLKKQGIQVLSGSAKQDVKGILNQLQQMCA